MFLSRNRFSVITANGLRIGDDGVFEKRLAGQVKPIEKMMIKLTNKSPAMLVRPG